VLVLTPILPAVLQACSTSSPNEDPGTPGDTCAGSDPLSTVNAGHTHSVCVPTADMTSPPAAGATYTSSNDGNHTHAITLTAAQLSAIAAGQSVTVTSTSVVDPLNQAVHSHNWTIAKKTTSTPPPPPSGW